MSSETTFNVLLIGAGEINFGSVEGPWNHTKRLEQKLGARLRVVGLIDLDVTKARAMLDEKKSLVKSSYDEAGAFASIDEAARELHGDKAPR